MSEHECDVCGDPACNRIDHQCVPPSPPERCTCDAAHVEAAWHRRGCPYATQPDCTPPEVERWTICANCGNVLQPKNGGFTHAPYRSCGDPMPITVVPESRLTAALQEIEELKRERDEYSAEVTRQSVRNVALQDQRAEQERRAEAAEAREQQLIDRIAELEADRGDA